MQIHLTEKDKMLSAMKMAMMQISLVNELTLDVSDLFQITLNLNEENKITNIFSDEEWPKAVDDSQIVKADTDKVLRAEGILYLFLNNAVKGIKFLDFGCGEGHTAAVAATQGASVSVGYDVAEASQWANYPTAANLLFTTAFSVAAEKGPYDAILLYDVLDHCHAPVEALKQVVSVLAPEGKVYVRCHPWCARHGGHLYRTLNKAYAHLFLSDEAVTKLSNNAAGPQRVVHPLKTYGDWFAEAGLKVQSEDTVREKPEAFFFAPARAEIIKNWWKKSYDVALAKGKTFPEFQLGQQFVDFVLHL